MYSLQATWHRRRFAGFRFVTTCLVIVQCLHIIQIADEGSIKNLYWKKTNTP